MKKEKPRLTKLQKKKKLVSLMALAMAITMILSSIMPYINMVFASPIEIGMTMPVSITTSQVSTNYLNASESNIYSPDAFAFGKDLFDLDVEVGYNGAYIYNEYFPIKGVINNLGNEFNGKLVVKSYANSNYYNSVDYMENYIEISLPANGNTSFQINSVLSVLTENIELSLFDNSGNEVYRNQFPVIGKSPYTNLIGILSDNKDSLEYLQYFEPSKLISDYKKYGYDITDHNVFLDESNFPKNRNIMNVYKTLIIDNFDISKLSDFQIELLEEWILQGGVLILGTGVNSEKTIGNLDFLNNLNFIDSNVFELEYFDYEPIFISDYNFDNWNEEGFFYNYSKEDISLFSAVKMGIGSVVICHSNFHLTPLSSNSNLTLQILEEVLYNVSGKYLTNHYENIMSSISYSDLYYLANSYIYFDNKEAIIPITIMAIYILLIFPSLYIFLKRKDKMELSWYLIPIIAVVFTSINFVLAGFSPYKNAIVNTVTLTEIKENNLGLNTEIYLSIRNSKNGDVNLVIDEEIEMNNYDNRGNGSYFGNSFGDNSEITERLAFSRNVGVDYIDVTYHDVTSWDTNIISGEIALSTEEFNINIYMEEGKYLGEITNNTGVDFYNAYLKIIDNIYLIGELLKGETYIVDIPINDNHNDKIFKDTNTWSIRDKERNGEITTKEAFTKITEVEFLNYALYKNNNQYYIPISVIGFSNENIIDNITVNGKEGKYSNLSGYLQEREIDIKSSDYFEIGINPNTENLGADFYTALDRNGKNSSIYYVGEDGNQNFKYSINKELLLENIKIIEFQEELFSNMENIELLNNKNDTWEVMKFDKPLENIQEYIYLEYGNDEEYFISFRGDLKMETEIIFPKMIVKGGK